MIIVITICYILIGDDNIEKVLEESCKLVGARKEEIAIMNSLTTNLHLLMVNYLFIVVVVVVLFRLFSILVVVLQADSRQTQDHYRIGCISIGLVLLL
jgi:kynureninase